MIEKKINLCNDILFKAVFQSEEARSVMITFLNHITLIPREELERAFFVTMELPKLSQKEKGKKVDLLVKLKGGSRIIVELNAWKSKNIFEKNTQYAFHQNISNTPKKVKVYPTTILININNFKRIDTKEPVVLFQPSSKENQVETNLYQSYHFILANARIKRYNEDKELRKFAQFLSCKTLEEAKQFGKEFEEYMPLYQKLCRLLRNEDFLTVYDREETHKEEIAYSKEEGIAIGEEKKEKEIARNFKRDGIPIEIISKNTGLTMEQIRML